MKLSDLIRSPNDAAMSITKVMSLFAGAALLAGFLIQAKNRDLDWSDWMGFALAITIITGGPLANRVISIWGGKLNGQVAPSAPSGDMKV